MLPLAEPEFEYIVEAPQRVIQAQVAFCSHQRHHAPSNDVREAQHADNVNQPEQDCPLGQPGNELRSIGKALHYCLFYEQATRRKHARRDYNEQLRGNLLRSGSRTLSRRSDWSKMEQW